jgi:hypothetical protein
MYLFVCIILLYNLINNSNNRVNCVKRVDNLFYICLVYGFGWNLNRPPAFSVTAAAAG